MTNNSTVSPRRHRRLSSILLTVALLVGGSLFSAGCQDDSPGEARAYQADHRTQLIGGPGALGEVGDYVIENDQIRLVIQNLDYNRGTGLFGGSLIDADLVRQDGQGDPFGGNGRDTFGEMFPAFFIEVINPQEIVVVDPADLDRDDIDDGAAVLEVRGRGGEFITMARFFNQAMVNAYDAEDQLDGLFDGELPDSDGPPQVQFTARYILEPGDRHVRIESEIENITDEPLNFPSDIIADLADLVIDSMLDGDDDDVDISFDDFIVPTGTAVGFGALNDIFMPGLGYDIRYGVEEAFERNPIDLPALPGHTTDIMASSSDRGVSYGFAPAPIPEQEPESNYVSLMRDRDDDDFYDDDNPSHGDEMLFIFEAAGYGAAFTHGLPEQLQPGESFVAATNFAVGSGDISSVRDAIYDASDDIDTQTVTGRLFDEATAAAAGSGANLLFFESADGSCDPDDDPFIINQTSPNDDGYFQLQLPPGSETDGYDYCVRARYRGETGDFVGFNHSADEPTQLQLSAPGYARIEAYITDQTGNPIPAKMTVVGEFDPVEDMAPREFLFEELVGERWRTIESVNIDPDDGPAQYIEMIEFSGADGRATADVTPGEYTVYFSRGNEYELVARQIEVEAGDIQRLSAQVERVFNPDGYLSGDYHLHAEGSIDSGTDYNDRVISIAAEGVEVAVATDHNYVSDYMPYIYRNNLEPFLTSIIGVESTTMEAGHFNAFPLKRDIADQNRGFVKWQNTPPDEIFAQLREMGSLGPDDTIIQVNHPRDALLGYFDQHNVDPFTGAAELAINSLDDDASFIDKATAAAISPSGPAFAEEYTDEDGELAYRSTFSYEFDAIELYNGKRLHLLHHFRMPELTEEQEQQLRDEMGDEAFDELPEPGVILCDEDDIAHAGALDDWYNFLNYPDPDGVYRKYTGTANSDSHHYGAPGDPEPGFPKNYFWAGHNDPAQVTGEQLSQALQNNRNISTNGPFIHMTIDDEPVGGTVAVDDGELTLEIEAMAADWVIGDNGFTYDVVANGERILQDMPMPADEFEDNRWQTSHAIDLDDYDHLHHADDQVRDTWFVIEVQGDTNLFPVVQPAETPMIPIDKALGELGEAFGFGGDGDDPLSPNEVTDIHPFAFTNPIWVVDDADGEGRSEFIPPEPPHSECVDGQFEPNLMLSDDAVPFGHRRLDAQSIDFDFGHDHRSAILKNEQGELRDIRSMFRHWHDH